jgi:nicotinamide riboside kinase
MERILFIGGPGSGKSTICRQCADWFKTAHTGSAIREYKEKLREAGLETRRLTLDQYYEVVKYQETVEERALPLAERFLFVDSGAVSQYAHVMAEWGYAEERLKEITLNSFRRFAKVFLCRNEFAYNDDGIRPRKDICDKMHKGIVDFCDENKIPYILIAGDMHERLKTVLSILVP